MQVSAQMMSEVNRRITELLDKAKADFPKAQCMERPKVIYKQRGTTAGTANHRDWVIDLNSTLLMENGQVFIDRTVVHEFCHLLDYQLHPENFESKVTFTRTGRIRRTKRNVHGYTWKRLMMHFGADPSRCHSYDVTNAKQRKRGQVKYRWTCQDCGTTMELGSKRHTNMKNGTRRYWMRGCGHHRGGYKFTHVIDHHGTAIPQSQDHTIPKPTPKPKRPTMAGSASKKTRAQWLYAQLKGSPRAVIIERFMSHLDMTKAGASTYYTNCKKEMG